MQEAEELGDLKMREPAVIANQDVYKDLISEVMEIGFLYYGRAFVAKISSTGIISTSPVGEIISINGDPALALKAILKAFKDISGWAVTGRALDVVSAFAHDHLELKDEIEAVLMDISPYLKDKFGVIEPGGIC